MGGYLLDPNGVVIAGLLCIFLALLIDSLFGKNKKIKHYAFAVIFGTTSVVTAFLLAELLQITTISTPSNNTQTVFLLVLVCGILFSLNPTTLKNLVLHSSSFIATKNQKEANKASVLFISGLVLGILVLISFSYFIANIVGESALQSITILASLLLILYGLLKLYIFSHSRQKIDFFNTSGLYHHSTFKRTSFASLKLGVLSATLSVTNYVLPIVCLVFLLYPLVVSSNMYLLFSVLLIIPVLLIGLITPGIKPSVVIEWLNKSARSFSLYTFFGCLLLCWITLLTLLGLGLSQ
jgi:hypothetical protein